MQWCIPFQGWTQRPSVRG